MGAWFHAPGRYHYSVRHGGTWIEAIEPQNPPQSGSRGGDLPNSRPCPYRAACGPWAGVHNHEIEAMSRDRYYLDLDAYRMIRRWCQSSPRREVGGILGGRGRHIAKAIKVPNVSTAPASSYDWTPLEYRQATQRLSHEGLVVIGQWHSHPRGYARPSKADLAFHSRASVELVWSGIQQRPRLWRLRGTMRQVLNSELSLLVCQPINGKAVRW